jgi:hypothetical protein
LRNDVYYVAATRISLDSIVYSFREGSSPESILGAFDGLTLAGVYGAIAFYLDHQTDIDAYLLRRRDQWAKLEREGVPPSEDLRARLARARQSVTLPAR